MSKYPVLIPSLPTLASKRNLQQSIYDMLNHGYRLALLVCMMSLSVVADDPKLNFSSGIPFGLKFDKEVTLSASFEQAEGTNRGRVQVKGIIAEGWHMYSVTQAKGGPLPTKITLDEKSQVKLLGPFTADKKPKQSVSDVYKGITIEEHEGEVIWTAPIEFIDAANATGHKFEVLVDGQACKDQKCLPIKESLTATFAGTYSAAESQTEFRDTESVVTWHAQLTPGAVRPGDDAKLMVRAIVDPTYHIYQSATKPAKFSTVFVVSQKGPTRVGKPTASSDPILAKDQIPGQPEIAYHEGKIQWTFPVQIDKQARIGEQPFELLIKYQVCTDSSCLQPRGVKLQATLNVGKETGDQGAKIAFSAVDPNVIDEAAQAGPWVDNLSAAGGTRPGVQGYSIPLALGFGLLGGLILNLMPCVLPVIGLKVMSFVEQGGQDRRKVLQLNVWYSLGILSIFWLLAIVAIGVRYYYKDSFSWGEQFTYIQFRVAMMIFVFAMALSFLGVWEIPLPGFATGSKAGKMQRQEGPAGAFSKGVFTTILATPCSGPFLGPVFGFMLTQSDFTIMAVFTAIGLGMASPYLLIGAFPHLIAWLPKPGQWMEQFKQGLAFLLLATVVFFFSTLPENLMAPFLGVLISVWFGCWIIGQVPNWEGIQKRASAWGTGICVAVLLSFMSFHLLVPVKIVDWEPYSEARLASLNREGKTVMLDFTADWCLSCMVNYDRVLNTESMRDILAQHNVVAMKADWTDRGPLIKAKLDELQSASIPLLAIYPASDPQNPIILPDLLTENIVKKAIETAAANSPPANDGSEHNSTAAIPLVPSTPTVLAY